MKKIASGVLETAGHFDWFDLFYWKVYYIILHNFIYEKGFLSNVLITLKTCMKFPLSVNILIGQN